MQDTPRYFQNSGGIDPVGGGLQLFQEHPRSPPGDAASRRDAMLHTSRHVRTRANRVIVWYFPADPRIISLFQGSPKQRSKLDYKKCCLRPVLKIMPPENFVTNAAVILRGKNAYFYLKKKNEEIVYKHVIYKYHRYKVIQGCHS